MMKKIIFVSMLCTLLFSCKKDQAVEETSSIVGSWHLTALEQIDTRSVTVGQEEVDIYINFTSQNTFQLYQMVGAGKYRSFSGTWLLDGDELSGTYDDKTAWGTKYRVELNNSKTKLILTSAGEQYIYEKEQIPDSILSGAK